jgi:hypothetical protein
MASRSTPTRARKAKDHSAQIDESHRHNGPQTIEESETWTLERPDAELFAAALHKRAKLGPRLARTAKRYEENFLNR